MSETFTASNGVEITLTVDGDETYLLGKGEVIPGGDRRWTVATGGGEGVAALREFFQHERDQELGRWRDPENLHRVAYATSTQTVLIMDESTGLGTEYSRQTANDSSDNYGDRLKRQSARAYFAAHPEPKPWHDAKPGEVWVLTTDTEGEDHAWMVDPDYGGGRFVFIGGLSNIPLDHPDISAGRRIWPEVSDVA